jgi:hypothetical protein
MKMRMGSGIAMIAAEMKSRLIDVDVGSALRAAFQAAGAFTRPLTQGSVRLRRTPPL